MRTSDFVVGSVYTVKRHRFTETMLVVMIASDRQYGIWHDSYEKNYRLFPYDQGMLVDSRGVAAVPVPKEIEDELLSWIQKSLAPLRFPPLAKLYDQYKLHGEELRELKGSPGVRWTQEVLGELVILPPSTIVGDIFTYVNMVRRQRIESVRREAQANHAVEDLKARFNAAFPALTEVGVALDLVLDSPHGAHSRVSIVDLELLADFINRHLPRKDRS